MQKVLDAAGTSESDVFDGVFALLDYGDGLVVCVTVDGATSMNQSTIALHAEDITVVANGDFSLICGCFPSSPASKANWSYRCRRNAKFSSVAPNVPPFLSLLDDYAQRIATGGGNAPTFAEALETQRVLEAVGFSA